MSRSFFSSVCDVGWTSADDVAEFKMATAGNHSNGSLTTHPSTALLSTAPTCPIYRHHCHPFSSSSQRPPYSHYCTGDDRRPAPSAPPHAGCHGDDDDVDDEDGSPTRTWRHVDDHQLLTDVIVSIDGSDSRPRCSACAMNSFPPPPYDETLYHRPAMVAAAAAVAAASTCEARTSNTTVSPSRTVDEQSS